LAHPVGVRIFLTYSNIGKKSKKKGEKLGRGGGTGEGRKGGLMQEKAENLRGESSPRG